MSKTRMFAKGGIATAAVGAMALAGATPAYAEHRDRDGIDAGDVVAGALIIGGIAAIASAASKERYGDGYRYRESRYGHGSSRAAVERCVRAVERDARRAGYRFAEVTQIRDVDRERRGWEVTGRLVVDGKRGWGYRDGYRDDYRYRIGYNDRYDDRDDYRDRDDRGRDYRDYRHRGVDRGSFRCDIQRGRVVSVDYRGIPGLNW